MKHIALNGSSGVALLRRSLWLRLFSVALLSPGLVIWNSPVLANPRGGTVVHGDVQIGAGAGRNLQIRQNSPSAIINWESFSIDGGELTQFRQPNRSSAVLNRITGGDPSAIHGAIKANGNVFVINPNGILVGSGGTIDVHGLVLSTLDVANGEFLARGDMIFKGTSGNGVNNLGRLHAIGGDVFLIGKTVTNSGAVSASQGTVGLAAGEEVLLTAVENGAGERVFVQAKGSGVSGTGIYNDGTIEGAAVELKAHGNLYALAINNKGSVRATGATSSGGRVFLSGAGGSISNSGSIRATSSGTGAAGRVLIEAAYAKVDGMIQAQGGSVRIAASEQAEVLGTVDVSSRTERGGDVVVEARDLEIGSEAIVNASGESGGGSIRIGGGFQGRDPGITNADSLVVHQGASFRADSLGSGAAGSVILWSDGMTEFEGNISAQAFGSSGDGGLVEVSGKKTLLYDGTVSTASLHGTTGTLLLDPENLEIGSGSTTANYLNTADLVVALASNQVVVSTGSATATGQTGTMTVSSPVTWSTGNQLALLAHGDIRFNASVQNSSTGSLIAIAGWNGSNGHTASSPGGSITGTVNFADFAANPGWYGNSNGSATGTIFIGNGSQTSDIAVGSRFGSTRVAASRLDLLAANGAAQLGYRAFAGVSATGNIDVRTGAGGVNLQAGAAGATGWAQIGHGGGVNINNVNLGGDVSIVTTGNVRVDASGTGSLAYAQIGMGSLGGYGNITGASPLSVRVIADGDVILTAGSGTNRSAHIGHGGNGRDGNISNGGVEVIGSAITLSGGSATSSNAHIGSGGGQTPGGNTGEGLISGDVIVVARSGDITLKGSGPRSFAQIGHGGSLFNSLLTFTPGLLSGNVHVAAESGNISVTGGSGTDAYAMIGHGADTSSKGTREGGIHVFAKGTITATDGAGVNSGAHLIHRSGAGLTAADYLGGNGFRLLANTTGTYSDGSLAGAGVMANANFGSGPVSFAFSNPIDIAIAEGSQRTVNTSDHLLMLTGGSLVLERGYQNSGAGDVVLVAGWNGVGTFSGGSSSHTAGGVPVIVAPKIDFDSISAFGQNGKILTIGRAAQTTHVRIGSRGGLNGFAGHGLALTAGTTGAFSSQLGFWGGGTPITGKIDLKLRSGGLLLKGGATSAYTQIGHGGLNTPNTNVTADIKITFAEAGDLDLKAGTGNSSYAQIGHGGNGSTGNYSGSITIDNARALALNAGRSAPVATYRYAHIGHGGGQSTGNRSGAIEVKVMERLDLNGGGNGDNSYAQIGHGGARGSFNTVLVDLAGEICVKVGGAVTLSADSASDHGGTYTLIGHGGRNTYSARSGDIRVVTGLLTQGGVTLTAGPGATPSRFAQIGHAGTSPSGSSGTAAGDLFVVAEKGGSILLNGTTGSVHNYALIGHGSLSSSLDSLSGGLSVFADGSITATDTRARIGHFSAGTVMNQSSGASSAGYQIVSNGTNAISDAALGGAAGVNTMVNAMIGNGPIRLALTNNFNVTINPGAAINAVPGEDFIILTGGNIAVNRTYQNQNAGNVVLVAGWDGTGSGASWAVNYGNGGTDYCDPGIIFASIGGFNSCGSFGNNAKTITIGSSGQTAAVRVGTRTGATILAAHGIVVNAGTTTANASSQIGYYGTGGSTTGSISLGLRNGGLTLNGGTTNGYAQVGHGGTGAIASTVNAPITITFCAPGEVTLNSGNGLNAYTQIGHGGKSVGGTKSGAITIGGAGSNTKAGAVSLLGGSFNGAYAFIGNGGLSGSGTSHGNIWIESGGLVNLAAGSAYDSFTQIGHGGRDANGIFGIAADKSVVIADGGIHLRAGTTLIDQYGAYSQIGNGGYNGGANAAAGNIYLNFNPNTMLSAGGGSLLLDGGASVQGAYAQVGHGGRNRNGNKSGEIVIGRADVVSLTSRNQFGYTQIGHGGEGGTPGINLGATAGSIRLLEVGGVSLRGGTSAAHTMIGHGGYQFGGIARGVAGDQIEIISSGDVTLEGGGVNSLVQIGHGGVGIGVTTFNTAIVMQVGGDLLVKGGPGANSQTMIGHGGFGTTAQPIAGQVLNSDITIDVAGDIEVRSGTTNESGAQIGHGGYNSMPLVVVDSNIAINTDLSGGSNGNLSLISTSQNGFAQIGHGGSRSDGNPDFGNKSGHITIGRVHHLTMSSGGAIDAYTQIGHGGEGGNRLGVTAVISGNISAGILGDLSLSGGSGTDSYSQIGHGGDNTAYASSGTITLTLGGAMDLTGGSGEDSYAQIGHGGNGALGTNAGSISVRHRPGSAALAFTLRGGTGIDAAAFIGHGGDDASGATRGHIDVHSNGRLDLLSGSNQDAYTLIGHGGHNNLANHGGIADEDSLENRILVSAQEGISLIGGNAGVRTFAKIGNGGYNTDGAIRGAVYLNYNPDSNLVTGAGAVVLQSGSAVDAFTHIGSGGLGVSGAKFGDVVVAGDSIKVATGSGAGSFSLIGIGSGIAGDTSQQDGGLLSGNTTVIATSGDVSVDATLSGDQAFAKIGAGGLISGGSTANVHRSDTTVVAAGELSVRSGSTSNSFAMIGLGGNATDGDKIGNIYVEAATITLLSGSGAGASTLIGNGGGRTGGNRVNLGNTAGDVDVRAGTGGISLEAGSALYTFSQMGSLGLGSSANHRGQIRVYSAGGVSLRGGTHATNADAVIGHGARGFAGTLEGDLWIHALGETSLVDQTGLAILGHTGTGATAGSTDFALITGTLNLAAASYGLTGTMARMASKGAIDIGILRGDLILSGLATHAAHGKDFNLFATGKVIIGASVQNAGTGSVNAVAGWDGVTGLITQIPAVGPPALQDLGLEINPLLLDDTAWGRAGGKVIIGGENGITAAAFGSAAGSTLVLGESVIVQGSETTAGASALLGFTPTAGVAPSGSITVKALDGGILVHAGNRTNSLAQIGHRSLGNLVPSLAGDIHLLSGGGVSLRAAGALQASAQIGHGGSSSTVSGMTGTISILVATDLEVISGNSSAAYAQVGHGGFLTSADISGDIRIETGGSIALRSLAPAQAAYAKFGHGDDVRGGAAHLASSGTRDGNLVVLAGGSFEVADALVGHRNPLSPATTLGGETWIGVARNDPTNPAEGSLKANAGSLFSGAEEIRFYLPRRENNQIAAGAVINDVSYGAGVTDPWPVQRPDEYTHYLETAAGTTAPAEHNDTIGSGPAPAVPGDYAFYYHLIVLGGTFPPLPVDPVNPTVPVTPGPSNPDEGPVVIDYLSLMPEDRAFDDWLRDEEKQYTGWGSFAILYEGYPQYGLHGESLFTYDQP